MSTDQKFMTTDEVATLVRSTPQTVKWWRHVKQGPTWFRIGRRVLYAETDVLAWLDAQRAAGTPN